MTAPSVPCVERVPRRSLRHIIADVYDLDLAIHYLVDAKDRGQRQASVVASVGTNNPYAWQDRVGCMHYDFAKRTPHYNFKALLQYMTCLAKDVERLRAVLLDRQVKDRWVRLVAQLDRLAAELMHHASVRTCHQQQQHGDTLDV